VCRELRSSIGPGQETNLPTPNCIKPHSQRLTGLALLQSKRAASKKEKIIKIKPKAMRITQD